MPRPQTLNRRIVALAIPALGSLVAEPLYLLIDTAIVGHLGTLELAALAIASQVLLTVMGLCLFLAYGATTLVAATADPHRRAQLGVQSMWLGAFTGTVVAGGLLAFADPITTGLAGDTAAAELAARYLRISAVGVAAQLVMIAGQGWLRGREQLGLALKLVGWGQVVNLVATVALVYGAGLGIDGAALGTVVAQVVMAGATLRLVAVDAGAERARRRPSPALLRQLMNFGGLLLLRSAALSGAFLFAASAAARISDPSVGGHQVGMQLVWLIALSLDALAIAAQVMIAGALGRHDLPYATAAARRVTFWSVGFGAFGGALLLAIGPRTVAGFFSPDPAVADAAAELWPWLCGMQILGGIVFALDGIFVGAGDGRALALSTIIGAAAFFAVVAVNGGGSLPALWTAIIALFMARAVVLTLRIMRGGLAEAPASRAAAAA